MENKLDGNAAAGTLQEIFPFEIWFLCLVVKSAKVGSYTLSVRQEPLKEGG